MRALLSAILVLLVCLPATPAGAQVSGPPAVIDTADRPARPDLGQLRAWRVLTDDDYPPFHYIAADGQLAGFNVDLARAVCQELRLSCTIQARRWDTLLAALEAREGDVVIASHAVTAALRASHEISRPYYRTPARFAARRDLAVREVTAASLLGRRVGVAAGSAHQAFLAAWIPTARAVPFNDIELARSALKDGAIDLLLDDAVALAIWLNGGGSAGCCVFMDGAIQDIRHFGEGAGAVFRKDQPQFRRAFDWALVRLVESGVWTDLYLKHFPVGFH